MRHEQRMYDHTPTVNRAKALDAHKAHKMLTVEKQRYDYTSGRFSHESQLGQFTM